MFFLNFNMILFLINVSNLPLIVVLNAISAKLKKNSDYFHQQILNEFYKGFFKNNIKYN